MTIKYDIQDNDLAGNSWEFEVEFEGFPEWTNDGIGPYEYWGEKCFDKGHDFVTMENSEITWDRTKHSERENKLIEDFVGAYPWKIEEQLIEAFEDYCKEY